MSDVQKDLENLIQTQRESNWSIKSRDLASAIVAQYDLIPKPVVTDHELGQMIAQVHGDNAVYHSDFAPTIGKRLRDQLAGAGLTIVRIEECQA